MPTIFVVMPFGRRPAAPEHEVDSIDFDYVYQEVIRKAAEESGWSAERIDENPTIGLIADQYLRHLYAAELVLADISLPNGNVYYELGIRQAVSAGGTILIAHRGTQLPFDIASQRVHFYSLNDDGAGSFVETLRQTLSHYRPSATLNPILKSLQSFGAASGPLTDSAGFEQDLHGRIQRARTLDQLIAVWQWTQNFTPLPALALLPLAERLGEMKAWDVSVEVLRAAASARPNDFEIQRRLGWHLRHRGSDFEAEALTCFHRALALNASDPETLGMLAGLLKRRGEYREASDFYSRGLAISPSSLYMRVNEAAMAILLAPDSPGHGLDLYRALLDDINREEGYRADAWAALVAGEAAFCLGQTGEAERHFAAARALGANPSDLRSAAEQLDLLSSCGIQPGATKRLVAGLLDIATATVTVGDEVGFHPTATSAPADLPILIHLSDIHFGERTVEGVRSEMHRFFDGEYSKTLSAHLISEFASRHPHFTYPSGRLYLVISGDLTYRGEPEEFSRVREFLEDMERALNIPRDRIIVVPGNHDVNWPAANVNASHRFDPFIGFVHNFYGPDLFRQRYPRVNWNLRFDTERPSPGELYSILDDQRLTIVGLNSCVYETEQHHYGFVGGRQLEHISETLSEMALTRSKPRVAVLHHHLHPFPELLQPKDNQDIWADMSTIRDAGLVEKRLERLGFDLVLHGHKHKAQLRETLVWEANQARRDIPNLIVCGAGSAGVNSTELEHGYSNHYEVIELLRSPRIPDTDFLQIEWRELAVAADAVWTTTRRSVLQG